MRSGRVLSLAVVVWLFLTAVPAFAACALGCEAAYDAFSYRTEYLWPGQTVSWRMTAYLDKGVAGPEEGPFYAYLVDRKQRAGGIPRVEEAVRLGVVETTNRRRHSFEASVSFSVPRDAALGSYAVEVCNDPCDDRLGYIGPTPVEVVAGDLEARLTTRIDALSRRIDTVRASQRNVAHGVTKRSVKPLREELAGATEGLNIRVANLAQRLAELERELAAQESSDEESSGASQSTVALGALIAGIFALLAWSGRRPRKPAETGRRRSGL
ncbi:MAG: hypothetical protein ACRDJL_01775 [Actinomycetota bacterium]